MTLVLSVEQTGSVIRYQRTGSVPDATGAPTSNYKEAEDDNLDPIIVLDGKTLELNTIGT